MNRPACSALLLFPNGQYLMAESTLAKLLIFSSTAHLVLGDVKKPFAFMEYNRNLANKANKNAMDFFAELRKELAMLVPETFMEVYDVSRIIHLERYIKAMTIRAQRFLVNFEKDQTRAKEVRVYKDSLNNLLKDLSTSASDEKRALIEEFSG